ncbi:Vms1/Ankzf1 family peptidyl-tRNA hydrolase [Haloplanus salilacus]|uniref:Vms1/Ankzf1 family peptidyl-tRNA hydrolase n=1 Tax=Haloplanus salilacus TaxID=2949994 RepID=UPI0030D049DA
MLDRLLGRAGLKARIEELEEEKRHLERRLDAESDRRADAVTDRQAAEERVNRLEDRIAELEDRVAEESADAPDLTPRGTESLRDDRLDEVLARLRSVETGPEGALTTMVGGDEGSGSRDDPTTEALTDALGDRAALARRVAPCLVCADDAGLVSVALDPPLAPAPFVEWGAGFRLDGDWFRPPEGLTVALVRSDLFAVGIVDEGGELRDVETVETDVQATHSKGGFSQSRFERRRDEQVAAHLDDCRAVLDRRDPDRLVLLGERTVLDELDRGAVAVAPVDATGDPEAALGDAYRSFSTVELTLL